MDEKPHLQDHEVVQSTYIKPQARKLHDPDVTFEEYYYYAVQCREEERGLPAPKTDWWHDVVLRKKPAHNVNEHSSGELDSGKQENFANQETRMQISDEEWANASRAFRTASWGACMC